MTKNSGKLSNKKKVRIYTQKEIGDEWEDYFDYAEKFFFEISEEAQRELLERRQGNDLSGQPYPSLILEYVRQNKVNFGFIFGASEGVNSGYCEKICLELKRSIRDIGYGFIEIRLTSGSGLISNFLFIPLIEKDELIKLARDCNKNFIFYSEISNFSEIEVTHDGECRVVNKYFFNKNDNVELFREILINFFKKLLKLDRDKDEVFKFQEREVPSFNRVAYNKKDLGWINMFG